MEKIGTLEMLCGLPGSGKSYFANEIKMAAGGDESILVVSSDEIRKELFGDESFMGDNDKVFSELHKKVRKGLKEKKYVVYDATSLNKRRRIAFLRSIQDIKCLKKCTIVATPYEDCLKNNSRRSRHVPEGVIKNMYMNFQPPHISEGWDQICILYSGDYKNSKYFEDVTGIYRDYDQGNIHHSLSLGLHMQETSRYMLKKLFDANKRDINLEIAALFHDIGKPFTRATKEGDDNAHYYQHHCVGAYESLFYVGAWVNFGYHPIIQDMILDIANLIYYHMHPYLSWKKSEKAMQKDKELLGEEFFNRVMLLHEADMAAR